MTNLPRPNPIGHRRGTAYVLVLALVMLMMAAGVGAVAASRVRTRSITMSNDTARAEVLAEASIERTLTYLNTNANWRTSYTSGVETAQKTFAGGTINFKLVDEIDGNLGNNLTDPVRIYGIERAGKATQVYSVILPGSGPLTCLDSAIVVDGAITFGSTTVTGAGMKIACNNNVTASSASIAPKVEAVGTITGTTYSGGTFTPATPRTMPDATVFDWYMANGRNINYASIPAGTITNCLLSPQNNPFGGGTDSQGIYIIDCGNLPITITACRIVGTLVLLNVGAGSAVQTKVNWAPAVSNYPCLLVDGDLTLKPNATTLAESGLYNFNPSGTPYPYPGGTWNNTTSDTFPSVIDGMVYVSGNLTTNSNPAAHSIIVGGTLTTAGALTLSYDTKYSTNPPPGFVESDTPMPSPGTWRREPAP